MRTEGIKPSKIFYGISGLLFVSGIIVFVIILLTGISSCVNRLNNQVVVPGSQIIELEETGKYSIYFEYRSFIDGKIFETNNISGLMCTLKNTETGESIKLENPSASSTYSIAGREGKSIFNFVINKIGKYEIKGWYEVGEGEEVVLVVGKGFGMALARTILLSVGLLVISIGGAIAIFICTLVRRKRVKNSNNTFIQSGY